MTQSPAEERPPGIPETAWWDGMQNWYDDPTYLIYVYDEDSGPYPTGTFHTEPYSAEQRVEADARLQKAELLRLAKQAIAANQADIQANLDWLAANPTASAFNKALVNQSTRQARQLIYLIRLAIEDFTSPI